jgi:hypothetical protein
MSFTFFRPSLKTLTHKLLTMLCNTALLVSCKLAFNQLFSSCFEIIVAMQLHVNTTSARSKLNSYCSHCKQASSGEAEFTYSKGAWVSKLPQKKLYCLSTFHGIVAAYLQLLKNQPMYFYLSTRFSLLQCLLT